MNPSEQRTFDLQVPCTCCAPEFCQRYHGLPMPPNEFRALLPSTARLATERARLYAAYDAAKDGDARVEAFRRLTAPFNSY